MHDVSTLRNEVDVEAGCEHVVYRQQLGSVFVIFDLVGNGQFGDIGCYCDLGGKHGHTAA